MSKVVEQLLAEIRDQAAASRAAVEALAAGAGSPAPGPQQGGSATTDKLLADILNQMIPMVEGVKELTDLEKAAKAAEARQKGAVSDLRKNVGGIPGGRAAMGISDSVGNAGSMLGKAASTVKADGLGSMAGMASVGAALGAVGAVASQVVGALGEIVSTSMKFVEALAPSTVEVFNETMRDLQATVGQALQPVIETATAVLRDFGATINPIMQELRPVVEQVADAFSGIASVVVDQFGRLLEGLVPLASAFASVAEVLGSLFESFTDIGSMLSSVFKPAMEVLGAAIKIVAGVLNAVMLPLKIFGDFCRAVGVVMSALFEAISAAFGSGLDDGMKTLKDTTEQAREAFQEIIKAGIVLVATFAKMSGMDSFVRELAKGLKPKDAPIAGMAAAKNAGITDYASFGKAASTAAFTASGTLGSQKGKKDWLEDIWGKVNEIAKDPNHKTWSSIIADGIRQAAADTVKKAASAARKFNESTGMYAAPDWIINGLAGGRDTATARAARAAIRGDSEGAEKALRPE